MRKIISATEEPICSNILFHLQFHNIHDLSFIAYASKQAQLTAYFSKFRLDP
jgi:hypothetical protein